MATSKFSITEGSGMNIATNSITEDAVTKQLQRVVIADDSGAGIYTAADHYMVTGSTSAIVAAALAANTTLMAMRNGATKTVYINRLRLSFTPATVGTSALVAGSIAWQRFTTATPTLGTARTVAKKRTSYATSTIADVRDSNAALTVTGVVFSDIFAEIKIPLMTTGGLLICDLHLDDNDPIILQANEGICLRTTVACPATQTWQYSYAIEWHEI